MTQYWFRPKRFGYGATPISWEGWAFSVGLALLVAASVTVAMLSARADKPLAASTLALCAVVAFGAIVALFAVARAKTDGAWRWRR